MKNIIKILIAVSLLFIANEACIAEEGYGGRTKDSTLGIVRDRLPGRMEVSKGSTTVGTPVIILHGPNNRITVRDGATVSTMTQSGFYANEIIVSTLTASSGTITSLTVDFIHGDGSLLSGVITSTETIISWLEALDLSTNTTGVRLDNLDSSTETLTIWLSDLDSSTETLTIDLATEVSDRQLADIALAESTTTLQANIDLKVDKAGDTMTDNLIVGASVQANIFQGPFVYFTDDGTPVHQEGVLYYDWTKHSLSLLVDDADVTLNIGRELWIPVRNNSGATITNGSVVYITGAIGQVSTIALARADTKATSQLLGIATHDIENNTNGYTTPFGKVNDIPVSHLTEGLAVYLSATTYGAMTSIAPVAPNYVARIGICTYSNVSGSILVNPSLTIHIGCGTTNQLLGMNSDGDEQEYKTLRSTDIVVGHSTGFIDMALADSQTLEDLTVASATIGGTTLPIATGENGYHLSSHGDGESSWVPASSASGLEYIADGTASDIVGYGNIVAMSDYTPMARSTTTAVGVAVDDYIGEMATVVGHPGVTLIPAGSWKVHVNLEASILNPANRMKIKVELYTRTAGGVEADLAESQESDYILASEQEYDFFGVMASTAIAIDTRIVGKLKVTEVDGIVDLNVYVAGIGIGDGGETLSRIELPSSAVDLTDYLTKTGDGSSLTGLNATQIGDGTVSNTELSYSSTTTGNIQDQIDTAMSLGVDESSTYTWTNNHTWTSSGTFKDALKVDGILTLLSLINTGGQYLSGDTDAEGIAIDGSGNVFFTDDIILDETAVRWTLYTSGDDFIINSQTAGDLISVDDNGDVTFSGALYGDGSNLSGLAGADSLGSHIATKTITLDGNYISGDGDNEGIGVDSNGDVTMGTTLTPYTVGTNLTVHDASNTSIKIGQSNTDFLNLNYGSNIATIDTYSYNYPINIQNGSMFIGSTVGGHLGNIGFGSVSPDTAIHVSSGVITTDGSNDGIITSGFIVAGDSITANEYYGDGSNLTSIIATTNANLTGPVTSVGNATAITTDAITTTMVQNLSGTNTGDQASVTGNAGTATALASDPTDCTLPNVALGINASGTAQCSQPSNITGSALTVTGASQSAITSVGTLTGLTVNGTGTQLTVGIDATDKIELAVDTNGNATFIPSGNTMETKNLFIRSGYILSYMGSGYIRSVSPLNIQDNNTQTVNISGGGGATNVGGALGVTGISTLSDNLVLSQTSASGNSIITTNGGTVSGYLYGLNSTAEASGNHHLQITNTGTGGTYVTINSQEAGGDSGVQFANIGASEVAWVIGMDNSNNYFGIESNYSLDGDAELVILPTGNVGIGAIAPTAKLVVDGNIVSSGTVQATAFYGDGSNLTDLPSGGGGAYTLIYSTRTTSSFDTWNITGLDSNTDGQYYIVFRSTGASTGVINIHINGDTTASNYYSQYFLASGTDGFESRRYNTPDIGYMVSGVASMIDWSVAQFGAKAVIVSHTEHDGSASSSMNVIMRSMRPSGDVHNITSLSITNTASTAFSAGTEIQVYGLND